MPKKKPGPELGRLFGRPDIERCDLFVDSGFLDWGKYSGKPVPLNEASRKGAQMHSSVPSGGHKKCGLQAASGYFDSEFRSILVKTPYIEKWKMMRRENHPLKGPWIPSRPSPKHSTPGDHYGTFTKISDVKAFSPLTKPGKNKEKEPINFLTNPGKKGNSGYCDIGINKYPPHTVDGKIDPYFAPFLLYSKNWKEHKTKIRNGPLKAGFYPQPFFEPNPYKDPKIGPTYVCPKEKVYGVSRGIFYPPAFPKHPGNNHDGCFTKFPEWSADPYLSQREKEKQLSRSVKPSGVFKPEPRLKTYYTCSVMNKKVDISCNERTWRTMKPITYPQFNL